MGRIKNIFVPGQIPSPTSFKTDDIIINPIDGKVYIKNTKNTTIEIGSGTDSASFATNASHSVSASTAGTASEVILIANNVPGISGTHNVLLGNSAGDSSRIAFDAQLTHNTVTNGLRVGTDAVKGSITASSILIEDGISLFISNSHLTSANILDLQAGRSIASDGKFASPISGDEAFTFMKSSEAGKIGLFATGSTIARFIITGDPSPSAIFNVPITASGNISASGDFTAASITTDTITATKIVATQFTSSIITSSVIQTEGSNIFGDAISDTQTFNGHITASGNISASDTMIMLTASIGGGIFTSASLAAGGSGGGSTNAAGSDTQVQFNDGGTNFGGDAGFTYNKTTNSVTAVTNISASGEISASGFVTPLGTVSGLSGSFGNVSASSNILGGGITINGNATFNSNTIDLGVDSGDRINANAFFNTRIHTVSDITASIISASGNIISPNILADSSSFSTRISANEVVTTKTLLSSSAQIAPDISGSFTAASSSFSTRVTANDAKLTANTSNVTSAGALMDSELAEIATVKALSKTGISGSFTAASSSFSTRVTANDAKVSYTDAAVTSVINAANILSSSAQIAPDISGSFTADSASFSTRVTANDAKLTANTSNVTSAGALMDSELAEIATVKALTKAGISGSFTAASSSFSTRVTANEVVTAKTLLSSSAQIASDISGSFTAASASFSTRVTANDAKVSYTDAAVKAKLNAENVVSGSKTNVLSFINVEDGADVTDTSNVTSAGALMDSELAEIATVKALTKAGISGSFTAASASLSTRITTNEAASASFSTRVTANDAKLTANTSNVTSAGALMDSELAEIATVKTDAAVKAKLNAENVVSGSKTNVLSFINVEDGADVTDTSNVTSAGALMDSELAEIATVKALTKAGISGSFTAASASFSTRVTANGAASASFSTRVTSNDAKLTANTSNVTSAGALMDSELAEIATVKALTKAGISGSFTAASASFSTRVTANEAASASFSTRVTANDAKLTANTSNVTSAGALMDSELAEIVTVKALTAAGISGSWQGQGFISASQVTENVGGGIISGAAQINSLINDTIAATIVAEIDNDEIPIAKLAEDSISGVALGSNLNNLTVDNATLQLNTGTTYNGSAARTISIKDGGVDSDALADDITVAGDLTVAGSIIHDGDTDTKISFPGPDVVSIKAGNTSVFTSSPTGSVLPNVHQNIFDTGSAALTANSAIGDIIKMGNSSTVAGGLYYLKGDGTWALAQANAAGTATGSLAVAVGTNSTTDGMCIRGFVNPFTDPGAGIGSPVYVNDTNPGRMLATAPSSTGDVVRIIGYQYGTDLIYFNPSNDFIIHA